jgi:translation initiation factor 2 beta subunit (eIF-2beta)/eIF-5
MCMKTDILQQGVSNAEHSYHRCPFCKSVNLKVLIEDKDSIHFICLECGKQDWKTKL